MKWHDWVLMFLLMSLGVSNIVLATAIGRMLDEHVTQAYFLGNKDAKEEAVIEKAKTYVEKEQKKQDNELSDTEEEEGV